MSQVENGPGEDYKKNIINQSTMAPGPNCFLPVHMHIDWFQMVSLKAYQTWLTKQMASFAIKISHLNICGREAIGLLVLGVPWNYGC